MERFTGKLMKFFYGRYGIDNLGRGMLVLYFALWFINLFIRSFIIWVIAIMLALCLLYRAMSKNIIRRKAENEVFLKFWKPVKLELRLIYDRIHDVKTSRYRKCHHCKAVIKLPKKRGKHTVRCPKCGEKFSVQIIL